MASKGAPIDKRLTNVVKTNAGIFHFPNSYSRGFPITAWSVLNVTRENIRSERTITPASNNKIRLKAKATDWFAN